MSFAEIRARLLQIPSYLASKTFLSLIGWRREGMGNVLAVKKTGEKLVCVVVGQVIDERLCCGPVGNHTEKTSFPKSLDAAKNTFMLGKPLDPDFAKDFDTAVRNIKNWEGSIAMTDDRRHFVEVVGKETVLKFAAPCWEARDKALKPPGDNGDEVEEFNVDDETGNWPIPDDAREKFDIIKLTHRVVPLPIYDTDRSFVDSTHANAKLRDALVEVHFTVKHYSIRKSPAFDSFSGIVQQVSIIKPAGLQKPNPYRVNLRNGPVNIDAVMDNVPPVEQEADIQTKTTLQHPEGEPIQVHLANADASGPSTHAQCIPEAVTATLPLPATPAPTPAVTPAPTVTPAVPAVAEHASQYHNGVKHALENGSTPPAKRSRDKAPVVGAA
ncbi:hypothetical protein Hypma_006701 [Hypsizygus marmoreus]|uniref:Uncharacterized protein n=1 Tax=Hypsizygus marmoreus TaxID=39966 RepID=A0A369JWX4_HYPMA|nr:hypothetical protein Hypma_006701 [Hypsizygus marmoreus]